MDQLNGTNKPFWPSAKVRYCTSDLKTHPIDKYLRKTPDLVISAEGIRAKESPRRAKKNPVSVRKAITSKALKSLQPPEALTRRKSNQRLGLTWYPLFDWSTEDVWEACGTSGEDLMRRQELFAQGEEENKEELKRQALAGWPCHPAYVYGNERVSCAICILASKSDIKNGARHNPKYFNILKEMEQQSGFSFKVKLSLSNLDPNKPDAQQLRFDI